MYEFESSLCAPGPDLSGLISQAESFYEAAKAPATIKAFDSDLASFRFFTTCNNLPYLPSTVETVVLYVSSLAAADPPMSYSTIRRRLSSISFAHRRRGLESPAVPRNHFVLREVLAGIRRTLGTAQHGAAPILTDQIQRIVAACPNTLLGKRDRSMVLFSFAAGSRAKCRPFSRWATSPALDLILEKGGLVQPQLARSPIAPPASRFGVPSAEHAQVEYWWSCFGEDETSWLLDTWGSRIVALEYSVLL
jgi:hypothetical protein